MPQHKAHRSPHQLAFQIAFWAVVFTLNVGPEWHRYSSIREVIEVVGTVTVLQWAVAMVAIRYLVPVWLDRDHIRQFAFFLLLLLVAAAEVNILISYSYLEDSYPETYGQWYQTISDLSLLERLGFSPIFKYILFSKLPQLFFPAAVLLAIDYYRRQQVILRLREQKHAAELDALKNQLNPHFIFNTLNNIYALAIKRSHQTAEAVAMLSSILDYVLYRCNDAYVSLNNEVAMMKAYIALEKLRFGDRVEVTFSNTVTNPIQVAPLLFLTLIENAFKHGTNEELHVTKVDLLLSETDEIVELEVRNTVPSGDIRPVTPDSKIGLVNLHRQLDILYPDSHRLDIVRADNLYTARLTLAKVAR